MRRARHRVEQIIRKLNNADTCRSIRAQKELWPRRPITSARAQTALPVVNMVRHDFSLYRKDIPKLHLALTAMTDAPWTKMSTATHTDPPTQIDHSLLQPLLWRLQDPPPLLTEAAPAPIVVLIDCSEALQLSIQKELRSTLSPSESQRFDTYRRLDDQIRFLVGRAGVRILLAAWHGYPAAAVVIQKGTHGKPFCPDGPEFNVSHSGDLILLAFHPIHPIGVDVEQLRPGVDWKPIARQVLTEQQQTTINQLPAAAQPKEFLHQWCAIEAELKAIGCGLAGLDNKKSLNLQAPNRNAWLWRILLPHGYCGAVAMASDR